MTRILAPRTILCMPTRQLELWSAGTDADGGKRVPARDPDCPAVATENAPYVFSPDGAAEFDPLSRYFLKQARGQRTRLAYTRDFTAFARWCAQSALSPLPASPSTLASYLTQLAHGGRKVSTVRRARIAIGMAHADSGLPRPDQDPRIRALERGMGRVYGTREDGASPLLIEHIERIITTLGHAARDDRDRVLLLLGFAGAFRGSELASLRIEQLKFRPAGLTIRLARPPDQPPDSEQIVHVDATKNVALCAVHATQCWLERVGECSGPLLRRVASETVMATPMQARGISRAIRRLAARAALKGDYSSHSLRAGLATTAYARGLTDREIQAHGRWKDRRSLDRYIDVRAALGRNLVSALG